MTTFEAETFSTDHAPGRPRRTFVRAIAFAGALLVASAMLVGGPLGATAHAAPALTPVMGASRLSAPQLADWYTRNHGSSMPHLPALHDDVRALARVFLDEGAREGVRGDIAFVQSVVETGWFSFDHSQIPPDANNYSGVYAFDGRSSLPNCLHGDSAPSRCLPSPAIGARAQMQLLRSYADPAVRNTPGRLETAPSDRAGDAPYWEWFGGHNCPCGRLIWASADNYGLTIVRMYDSALATAAPPCVPYGGGPAPSKPSGSGYLVATTNQQVRAFGSAVSHGSPANLRLNSGLVGGEQTRSGNGYWLLGGDGGIFSYGDARFRGSMGGEPLNAGVIGMAASSSGSGYWLVAYDGGVFSFGDARFHGSTGSRHLQSPVLGIASTRSGRGYWLFAADGGVFAFGDARFYGSLGGRHLNAPVVAMQRTESGKGYWLLAADGGVFAFGDAGYHGSTLGCNGGAMRMLVTPSGGGYWIATRDGRVVPYGDARNIGGNAAGLPVALLGNG